MQGLEAAEEMEQYKNFYDLDATLVANEFLDKYMPKANGDYVKVYLFLLKHRISGIDVATVAEALELTEGDVRRALRYWEEQGILIRGAEAARAAGFTGAGRIAPETEACGKDARKKDAALSDREELRRSYKRAGGAKALSRLAEDDEFRQLLFVVQKYMSKILTDNDQQVFAYLYDGLKMPCEVLDYLVDYCVQKGHDNIRYIEKVGLDWYDSGIRDVEAAKCRTKQFDREAEGRTRRKTVREKKLGMKRDTDLNALVLEQVARRMEQ